MVLQENTAIAETAVESLLYTAERGKPMPSFNHGSIQANLIGIFQSQFKKQYRTISELSLDLADWPSVPDIVLYPRKPLDLQNDLTVVTEPPLCAIEIISPTQSLSELTHKAHLYFLHGVKSCWLVLPPLGNIFVFSSPGEYEMYRIGNTLRDSIIDIQIPLSEVFE